METRCDVCKRTVYQCFHCKQADDDTKKAIRKSIKKKKDLKPPSPNQVKQDNFLRIMRKQFLVKEIDRDGDCCFTAFAAGYWKVSGEKLTSRDLRKQVSEFLLSSNGQVPGMVYQQFEQLPDGRILSCAALQAYRNRTLAPMALQEYARKVEKDLYGGDLEVAVLAHLFKVQIHIYTWQYYHESNIFAPQHFGDISAKDHVSMLWEQNFDSEKGGQDHYDTVYTDYYLKWRRYMFAMPEWKKDIGPCFSEVRGRGIKALRAFKAGDVLLFYDGHRVNSEGGVVFERQAVKHLFEKYNLDPASIEFQRTHSVGVGRSLVTDVLIDGYPLTLSMFDPEPCIGRGALANSANLTESNMIMEWHDAPDLPLDHVDKIRNKEGFLVARRDIEYVTCLP